MLFTVYYGERRLVRRYFNVHRGNLGVDAFRGPSSSSVVLGETCFCLWLPLSFLSSDRFVFFLLPRRASARATSTSINRELEASGGQRWGKKAKDEAAAGGSLVRDGKRSSSLLKPVLIPRDREEVGWMKFGKFRTRIIWLLHLRNELAQIHPSLKRWDLRIRGFRVTCILFEIFLSIISHRLTVNWWDSFKYS